MRKPSHQGPQLPGKLLDELGASGENRDGSRRQLFSLAAQRTQRRKASRVEKRTKPGFKTSSRPAQTRTISSKLNGQPHASRRKANPQPRVQQPVPVRSKPREETPVEVSEPETDSDGSEEVSASRHVSLSVQNQLDEDDAAIARLEKKLGRKRKRPEDGMASLFKDLDGVSDDDGDARAPDEFDQEAVDWLRAKRRKAEKVSSKAPPKQDDNEDEEDDFAGFSGEDEDTVGSNEEDGDTDSEVNELGSESGSADSLHYFEPPKKRENPYMAPVPGGEQAKYVPPSRRADSGSDDPKKQKLKRQIQGLLNRLSESNMVDIVKQIGTIYLNNARHDVSQTLLDHLINLLSDRTVLNDTFIILHAGFVCALHRTVGIEFGAAAVSRLVEEYDKQAKTSPEEAGKKTLNLAHTLAELYNFQVIGSTLIYDLVKGYINDLSETDAELLLKIVRNSGWQLRQDDPSALKEIAIMLQATVKRLGGEENLNVRTRFMIETIENLKNNKQKANQGANATVNTEHVQRMKKTLGSLSSTPGISARSTEPLRISLSDIRDSDLRGKWWLVGASFRDEAQLNREKQKPVADGKSTADSLPAESTDIVGADSTPDMASLARAFGMNTDVRKALFVNIMTAATADEARERLVKMRLTKKQMREVPPVLVRCATAERAFNAYYADIARRMCAEREIRKAMWNPLLEVLGNLEDEEQGGTDDEEEESVQGRWWRAPQAKFNVAKLYGALLAEGVVPITVLAGRDLVHPNEGVRVFLELMFVGMFCSVGRGKVKRLEQVLRQVAGRDDTPNFLPLLGRFLRRQVAKTVLVAPEEKKVLKWGCEKSEEILAEIEKETLTLSAI